MSTGSAESAPQSNFEFTLPPQSGEQVPNEQKQETGAVGQEVQNKPRQAQPQLDQQAVAPPPSAPPIAQQDNAAPQQQVQSATQHLQAEESDLIEKEWVERAKQIVAATQDDPFKQKSEISKAKADYIQKRFNKSVKVDDAAHA